MASTYELIIDDDAGMTTVVPLFQKELSIGRKLGNTIQLSERNVSRHHARLLRAGDSVQLEDLSSYTGVLLNGQRITGRAALQEGDLVQIGDYRLALRRVAAVVRPVAAVPVPPPPPAPLAELPTRVAPVLAPTPRPEQRPAPQPATFAPRRAFVIAAAVTAALLGVLSYERRAPSLAQQPPAPPAAKAATASAQPHPAAQPALAPASSPRPPLQPVTHALVEAPARPRPLPSPRHVHHSELPHAQEPAPEPPPDPARPAAEQATAKLEEAQSLYIHGDFAESIKVARTLSSGSGVATTRAWRIVGAAACKLGDRALATQAYHRVDSASRQYMLYVCQQSGLAPTAGAF